VTGRPVVSNDYANSDRALAGLRDAAGARALVAVPVHEHGTVVGCITVASSTPGHRFGEEEVDMLATYAEQASLAMAAAKTLDTMRHAFNDPLTGLANRALFLDRLELALDRARRSQGSVAVLFLDLDRFKLVNDSLGHAAGDALLVGVAERLRDCLRRDETVARLGGDEFAVLIDDIDDADDAVHVAQRVAVSLRAPFSVGGRELFTSASVGIATGHDAAEDLVRFADMAMYKAKKRGKGSFELFRAGMHTELLERLELEADIQHALDRDELELHYQPIIDLGSGRVVAGEALIRWRHPERGLVSPGEFIPVAEETGLILPIGDWVMEEACRQAAEWRRSHGDAAPAVTVNISGVQLERPELVAKLRHALLASGLPPRSLIIELTETVLMSDTEANIASIEHLKTLDVRVAVDDFGTGYSSLRYLQRFPIDILKVAKPFVDGLAVCSEEGVLARAITDLARNLGLGTIAEGIEMPEQADSLRAMGCELGQGFLFARPLVPAAFAELLAGGGVLAVPTAV
jgi:diguanylate cyclase (GGDEF)-like protein